jgi:hypothetical protein
MASDNHRFTLSEKEIEDIKDDIKFRTMVAEQLKGLNGIPKKVWQIEGTIKTHWFLLSLIIAGFVALWFKG